ncbi:DUF2274 domain-containing protein [Sphingomonas sp. CJ20]
MALKLGIIADDKPVRLTLDLPADVYRDLVAYAEAHAEATGQTAFPPGKLAVPMLVQFMATDRGFAKLRRSRLGTPPGG